MSDDASRDVVPSDSTSINDQVLGPGVSIASPGFEIAQSLQLAQALTDSPVDTRLRHLHQVLSLPLPIPSQARECLLHRDPSGSLLDNFLDEMLEFLTEPDARVRCFIVGFLDDAW
jgi:hypothetical protein